jgi:hypothetical protein
VGHRGGARTADQPERDRGKPFRWGPVETTRPPRHRVTRRPSTASRRTRSGRLRRAQPDADLVVSASTKARNLGPVVDISGTVGGAADGATGVPALAVQPGPRQEPPTTKWRRSGRGLDNENTWPRAGADEVARRTWSTTSTCRPATPASCWGQVGCVGTGGQPPEPVRLHVHRGGCRRRRDAFATGYAPPDRGAARAGRHSSVRTARRGRLHRRQTSLDQHLARSLPGSTPGRNGSPLARLAQLRRAQG